MTLTTFQETLHTLYQGNGSTPTSTSDEYEHRTVLANTAIRLWNREMRWDELWATLEDASDGDKTIVADTTEYDMPTDFVDLGAFVRVTDSNGNHTYYEVMKPQENELFKNTTAKAVYVTGNKSSGFKLNFMEQPTAGDTINYPYYKEPTELSTGTDVFEMSDPDFAVYWSLGKLHEHAGAGDRAELAFRMAGESLSTMRKQQLSMPYGQSNKVPNRLFLRGRGGFGVSGGWGRSRYGDQI